MKSKLTILNVATSLFLLACVVYTIADYRNLSYEEGWGVIYMIAIFIFWLTAFIPDLIIRRLIKNRIDQNKARAIVLAGYIIILVFEMKR